MSDTRYPTVRGPVVNHRGGPQDSWPQDAIETYNVMAARISTLEDERDRAREDCGHAKAMRASISGELDNCLRRLLKFQKALDDITDGAYTLDEVRAFAQEARDTI